MQYKVITLPIFDSIQIEEDLNKFLRTHKVISVEKKIIEKEGQTYWSFLIEYLCGNQTPDGATKRNTGTIDYKEILSEDDFAIFSCLRDLRKQVATKDGLPAYTIFTNEQLAQLARKRPESATAFLKIDGIGNAKIEKYGKLFLEKLKGFISETSVSAV